MQCSINLKNLTLDGLIPTLFFAGFLNLYPVAPTAAINKALFNTETKGNQKLSTDTIPKLGDRYIHLVVKDSDIEAFSNFSKFLADVYRYSSIYEDDNHLFYLTSLKRIPFPKSPKLIINMGLQFTVFKNDICIAPISSHGPYDIPLMISPNPFTGALSSINHIVWKKALKIVSTYPHSKIYYSIK